MFFTRALTLIIMLIVAIPAHANESQVINGHYSVQWNNIPIATIKILVTEDADSYNIYSKLRSSGIVRWVKKFKRQVWAEGLKDPNSTPKYKATHYKYTSERSRKKRTVELGYKEGILNSINVTPPDNPDTRDILTVADGIDAYDPLTMLLLVHDWVWRHINYSSKVNKTLSFPMTDGRRLMNITLTSRGYASIAYRGEKTDVIHLKANRTPIKGFSQKEMDKYNKGEPELHIYVSTTAPHIPLLYRIDTQYGLVEATWKPRE